MRFNTFAPFTLVIFLCWSSLALAHHSNAMFDRDKEVVVTGTVREFQWTNPHVFIELTVDTPAGPQNYSIECPNPGVLRSRGWKFNSLKAGDKIVAKVHPLRTGVEGGGLISLTKDGMELAAEGGYTADKVGK